MGSCVDLTVFYQNIHRARIIKTLYSTFFNFKKPNSIFPFQKKQTQKNKIIKNETFY